MTNPNLWNQLLIWPITNLLIAFYKLCEFLHLPGPFGFAIILMTLTFRIILYPIMAAQMKSTKKMATLKPHLDALNKKHKNDKQALQTAQMALYKEHGVNPAAGCLPLLLQMPILFALYNVFFRIVTAPNMSTLISEINKIVYSPQLKLSSLNLSFLGYNLATKPNQCVGVWLLPAPAQQAVTGFFSMLHINIPKTSGCFDWWLLFIPLITALLQWYQTKQMMASAQPVSTAVVTKDEAKDKKEEKSQEDMAADMQKQMAIISPIMFGIFAFQFPVGLALYWNVFGLFGIIQQQYINKKL